MKRKIGAMEIKVSHFPAQKEQTIMSPVRREERPVEPPIKGFRLVYKEFCRKSAKGIIYKFNKQVKEPIYEF